MQKFVIMILLLSGILLSCSQQEQSKLETRTRGIADTIGFAHLDWQMDSVIARIERLSQDELLNAQQPEGTIWKTAICPHDDYTYTNWLYPAVLKNIKANTVIMFGVAHQAYKFKLKNKIVFDSYDYWHGPYGNVKVSPLRDEIISQIPRDIAIVHDSMQTVEHSVESMIPFLQYQNRDVEIISILVPYMNLDTMQAISQHLAKALANVMTKNNLQWGKDVALLITSDAVHYGDEDWGGQNFARYGSDSTGNAQAVAFEHKIINTCFDKELTKEKITRFYNYTIDDNDYRKYKWTWCGRYSIPFGLLTSLNLQAKQNSESLNGVPVGYGTSITQPHIKVDDLRMGQTAVATQHHWVGYPAIGFE